MFLKHILSQLFIIRCLKKSLLIRILTITDQIIKYQLNVVDYKMH